MKYSSIIMHSYNSGIQCCHSRSNIEVLNEKVFDQGKGNKFTVLCWVPCLQYRVLVQCLQGT